ncbi:MAG: hypothetical protein VX255_09180 [Candidatus Latescibacterota bacterium]|nr:hypothetical protein [Candidatus Latescibacterota bacterium]
MKESHGVVDGALDLPFQFRAQVVAEQRIAQVTGFLCVDFTTLLALADVAELGEPSRLHLW